VTGPDRLVRSADGTSIAVFSSGSAAPGTRPLILVHGTIGDHTAFRVVAPLLGLRRRIHAIDRRGRGASGDAPDGYEISREFDDVAGVADAIARDDGGPVDVVGHSFGGRCSLGAALRTAAIRRVVCYEGAPPRDPGPESAYEPPELPALLRADLDRGANEVAVERFMRTVVGMDDAGIARYRADPVWPRRAAAAITLPRELDGSNDPAAGLEALSSVRVPVLQILGSASAAVFADNTRALDRRLALGQITMIEGAAHAAHHTHPEAFVAAVEAFLENPSGAPTDAPTGKGRMSLAPPGGPVAR
jgi:pimeloyl-ACP methyl ester carboxylesterase